MALSLVREVGHKIQNVSGVTSIVVPVTTAPAAGHLLILSVSESSFGVSTVTDSAGNTWTVDATKTSGTVTSVASTGQNIAALTTADTVTVTFSGAIGRAAAAIHEISGADTSGSRVDKTATGTYTTTTSRSAGTTATTTSANALVWAAFGPNAVETSFAAGTGYSNPSTSFYAASSAASIEFAYQIVGTTGAYSPTGTGGATASGAGVTVVYKAAAGATLTTLLAGGLSSTETFGTPTLRAPQAISGVGAINSGEAFGSGDSYGPAIYGRTSYGPGGSAAQLSGFNANLRLTVSGVGAIPTAQAIGTPIVRPFGTPTTVTAVGIGTAEAIGRPSLFTIALPGGSSSYGAAALEDDAVYTATLDDALAYTANAGGTKIYAGTLDDLQLYREQLSDALVFAGSEDDTPGH